MTSRWIPVAGMALAAVALCAIACSRKSAGDEDAKPESAQPVAEVTVTQVARADISSMLTVTGTIAGLPNEDVKVSSLVPGRVAQMLVAEGDHASEGQALAKIDDRPFLDQIRQAEAGVEQAKANLENARLNRDRNENLFQRGIAARKEVEDARTQMALSEAAQHQADAALSLAKLQLSRTEVRSPLAGTVVKRLVSVGEQVDGTAATPIFEVASLTEVELFGNVPGVYLGKIRVKTCFSAALRPEKKWKTRARKWRLARRRSTRRTLPYRLPSCNCRAPRSGRRWPERSSSAW